MVFNALFAWKYGNIKAKKVVSKKVLIKTNIKIRWSSSGKNSDIKPAHNNIISTFDKNKVIFWETFSIFFWLETKIYSL